EDPAYSGTKTDMTVVGSDLVLSDSTLWDDLGLIDSVGDIDFPGSIVSEGTYEFATTVNLGGVWPSRIYSVIQVEAFDIGLVWDSHTDLMDDWATIDGDVINDVDATLYIRTTEDNPAGSPTWTDWKRINAGEYLARGMQFKLFCTSGSINHNLRVKQLEVTVDMADRTESTGKLTSGAGAYAVTYSYPFYATPSVAITAVNLTTGDYWVISSEAATGFSITFKNAAGTAVSRDFYVVAKGYGRKVA